MLDAASIACIVAGIGFFFAGAVGLLRFPDVHSRLHALTKADNLGLGFVAFGMILQAQDIWLAMKFLLIWILTMLSSATVAQLVARSEMRRRAEREKAL